MPKPKLAPFTPHVQRSVPPAIQYMHVVAQCPVCGRLAFGVLAITPAVLAGQQPRQRLAGIECPWCLTVSTMPEAEGHPIDVQALPLDHAARARAGHDAPAEGIVSADGGLIARAEEEAEQHTGGAPETGGEA